MKSYVFVINRSIFKTFLQVFPNQFWWRNKLFYILDGLTVSTFSANFHFWLNYSFNGQMLWIWFCNCLKQYRNNSVALNKISLYLSCSNTHQGISFNGIIIQSLTLYENTLNYQHTDSQQNFTYSQKRTKAATTIGWSTYTKARTSRNLVSQFIFNVVCEPNHKINRHFHKNYKTTHHKSWHFWGFVQASVKIKYKYVYIYMQ